MCLFNFYNGQSVCVCVDMSIIKNLDFEMRLNFEEKRKNIKLFQRKTDKHEPDMKRE